MSESQPPPTRWRRLLARVVPREDRDHVVDELDALYAGRLERSGARDANRWYRREVLSFAMTMLFVGVPSWLSRLTSTTPNAGIQRWRRHLYFAIPEQANHEVVLVHTFASQNALEHRDVWH